MIRNITIIHKIPLVLNWALVLNNSNVLCILLICFSRNFVLFLIKFIMSSHVVLQIINLFLFIFFLWTLFIYNVPYEIHILPEWQYDIPSGNPIFYFLFGPNIYSKLAHVMLYIVIQCYNITLKVCKVSMLWTTNGPRLLQNGQVLTIAMNCLQFDLQHNVCMPTIDSQQYINLDFLIVLQLW